MKISEIEIARQIETPAENETQRVLRRALELLGPNGERWLQKSYASNGSFCARGAVCEVSRSWGVSSNPFLHALDNGAGGGPVYSMVVNDHATSFAPVRAMFLRAIELAS